MTWRLGGHVFESLGTRCTDKKRDRRGHTLLGSAGSPFACELAEGEFLMANHGDKRVMVEPALSGTACALHEAVYFALLDD